MQKVLFSKFRNIYFLLESDWKIHNCVIMRKYMYAISCPTMGKVLENHNIRSSEIMKNSERLQPCVVIKLVVD